MATAVIEQPKIESEPKPLSSLFEMRHRITVEEYHRILDSGVFGPEPKVELLEGVIVEKMTKKPPHVHATDLLEDLLHHLLPRGCGYFVSMGNPVTIEDRDGEPEPDAGVFRGSIRDFGDRQHTPAEAALLAEVSHTSYDYDRYAKWVTYATRGCRCTGSSISIAGSWKSTPSRRARARPRLTPELRSSAPMMRSRSSSTAARSAGSS